MGIKKIVITGDSLRLARENHFCQNGNITWLDHLLRSMFNVMVPYLPVQQLMGEKTRAGENFAERFYAAMAAEPVFDVWVKIFHSFPNPRQLAIMEEVFQDSLVVSFELPEILATGLNSLNIPWIDFTVHPVRFMEDIPFGVRSNIPGMEDIFAPWALSDDAIKISAGHAMSLLSRLPRLESCATGENIAIFACQTTDDKVLINDGKITTVADYADEIVKIALGHDKILVKPHPCENDNTTIRFFTQFFPNAEIITDNIYLSLSHDNVKAVYSLCSSSSIESRYMGKRGVHLAKYPFVFSENSMTDQIYMAVYDAIWRPELWNMIFEKFGLESRHVKCPPMRVNIRNLFDFFWGADIFKR